MHFFTFADRFIQSFTFLWHRLVALRPADERQKAQSAVARLSFKADSTGPPPFDVDGGALLTSASGYGRNLY